MVNRRDVSSLDKPAPAWPWRTLARLAGCAALLCALGALVAPALVEALLSLGEWARALPRAAAMPLCVAAVTAWVVLCLPTTPLEIALGFALGWPLGVAAAVTGKALGSFLVFAAARRWLREWAERFVLREFRAAAALRVLMAERPWWTLTMVRLAYIPIAAQNVAPAVLPCPPRVFAAVAVGTGAVYASAWCNIGSRCADVAELRARAATRGGSGGGGGGGAPALGGELAAASALGIGAVVALALLLCWSTRRLERELRRRGTPGGGSGDAPRQLAGGGGGAHERKGSSEDARRLLDDHHDASESACGAPPEANRFAQPPWLGGAVA